MLLCEGIMVGSKETGTCDLCKVPTISILVAPGIVEQHCLTGCSSVIITDEHNAKIPSILWPETQETDGSWRYPEDNPAPQLYLGHIIHECAAAEAAATLKYHNPGAWEQLTGTTVPEQEWETRAYRRMK